MRCSIGSCALIVGAVVTLAAAQPPQPTWTQLSLETCNVNAFLKAHPEHDGRGVVIAVLDTGVDPSIPGLTHTPDGGVKVIDVQDFSGEGDTELHRVLRDADTNAVIEHDKEGAAISFTLPDLPASQQDEKRLFWFGWFEEKKFINTDMADLNDDGSTDDRFAILVTAFEGDGDDQAVAYVDTDMDRSFADEKPLRNYKLEYDTFTLGRKQPEKQIIPATFAVNIFLRQSKIVIHFDDGAHGTHVAGIAAGYRINNQAGFNGVAPGAKVISLKIGQNAIGGISTTDAKKGAMEYAARFAREHDMPVICNLSYGVESTIEGHSDIDEFMDEHLTENPHLVLCTSGGNEGPGLSTIGTPAAADEVISVAALMAVDTGRDVEGFDMKHPVVTVFSSRGGEVPKPDIATPGWSTSTVPRWVREGDFWAGTSMASPYAAGICALLVSHAQAEEAGKRVRSADLKRAMCLSASMPPGATPLDAGYGIPDVVKAADVLKALTSNGEEDPVLGYDVVTKSPHGYGGESSAAFWRSTYLPVDEPQRFTITPVFAPGVDGAARTAFTRKFTLRSQTPWCKVNQSTIYLRSEQDAEVFVEYDGEKLTEPGFHVGVVEALHEDRVAFRLLSTIVVPYRFSGEEDFARKFNGKVDGWIPDRYFLAVPPGASAMYLLLSAPEGATSKASIERIFDPEGFQLRKRTNKLDTATGVREIEWTVTDELVPGVWEVDIVADRPDKQWPYDLKVRFFGLQADPWEITEWDASGSEPPSGELTVTNLFERRIVTQADGEVEGFRMNKEDNFKGLKHELSYTINLGKDFDSVRIELEMSPEAWAEATDIGVAVEDESGKAIHSSAFDNNTFAATVKSPKPGQDVTLKLKIRAGFAISDDQRETAITVNIDHLLADPVGIKVTRGDSSTIDFVPAVPSEIEFEAERALPAAPDGTSPVGFLRFRERGSGITALRVPIVIED